MANEPNKRKRRRRKSLRKELVVPPRRGRQPFIPTDAQRQKVENLVACDWSNIDIAAALKIPIATMEQHFREELNSGKSKVFSAIVDQIAQQAKDGDKTMLIYMSKARLGWRERTVSASFDPGRAGNGSGPGGPTFVLNVTG